MTPEKTESSYLAWLAEAHLPADALLCLLQKSESPEALYQSIMSSGDDVRDLLSPDRLIHLQKSGSPENLIRWQNMFSLHHIGTMTFRDSRFPDILQKIEDPVSILFFQGDPSCLTRRMISMVGARRASHTGLKAAGSIARDLSRAGVSIVSGFAYGIDSASHQGCLEGGSPTIAVLGCGPDQNYPADHAGLRERVLESGGLILSEYSPGEKPLAAHFPYRNRIISALGEAVVLVEARIKSGSLRTVEHGLRQGKDIFVYPGDPLSPNFEGNHQLLREGARYFTSAEDILEDLNWLDKMPPVVQNSVCTGSAADISPEEERIRQLLQGGEMSFEQLTEELSLAPPKLMGFLTIMQIKGLIEPVPGKKYQLKESDTESE